MFKAFADKFKFFGIGCNLQAYRNILLGKVVSARHFTKMNGGVNETTAGVIIIGDEIIRGHVQDCNSYYLCQKLHHLGVNVRAIITVPDDLSSISEYVTKFSNSYTHVVTAGGIGPTHDDITYEAIAKAFSDTLRLDAELEQLFKRYFKEKYTKAHEKLAKIPSSAELVRNPLGFPIVSVKNVYVLPGVPKFLQLAFGVLEKRLHNPLLSFYKKEIYLSVDEMKIVTSLTEISEQFKETVAIGSYPEWHNNYYKVKLVLESLNEAAMSSCNSKLVAALPANSIVNYKVNPLSYTADELNKVLSELPMYEQLARTMEIISEAMDRYKPSEICIGFNGGKDCTALLYIWYATLVCRHSSDRNIKLNSIYIRSRTPFPEAESFIEETITRYNLNMLRFDGNIKEQLGQLKQKHPEVKAVVMGTRHCDPHGANLQPFQETDVGWPSFMRINPILHWSYRDVWLFLRQLSLPYCSLYDVGYTSLGSMENTHPNPALRYTDSNDVIHYRPAYTLVETHSERAGRTIPKQ